MSLWVLKSSHKTKVCHPGWQMGEEQAGAVGHPGPGEDRQLPFQDPESFSVSPAISSNCLRMRNRNLGNVGHWHEELMSLPWSYLHVKPLIFSFGMLWFPICEAQCLRQAGRSLGIFPLSDRFPLSLAFSTAKCFGFDESAFSYGKTFLWRSSSQNKTKIQHIAKSLQNGIYSLQLYL